MTTKYLATLAFLLGTLHGVSPASAQEPQSPPEKTFSFLGTTYCLPTATPATVCDVRSPRMSPTQELRPRQISILGLDVCIGEVRATAVCDLRLPAPRVTLESTPTKREDRS